MRNTEEKIGELEDRQIAQFWKKYNRMYLWSGVGKISYKEHRSY